MTVPQNALEAIAPAGGWHADWPDVLTRVGERRRVVRRRLVLAVAIAVVVVVPLTALGAANNWWFFRFGAAPTPTSAPVVVKTGTWEGKPWQLVAYPSTTDGLCFGITPGGSDLPGEGAAMSCGPVVGVPRTSQTKQSPDMPITFLASGGDEHLPAYIAGPVIASAATVEIRLADGQTVTTPTFAAPSPLEHVRFYATPAPEATLPVRRPGSRPQRPLIWVAGLDASGAVVACLAPESAKDGVSPLSACS